MEFKVCRTFVHFCVHLLRLLCTSETLMASSRQRPPNGLNVCRTQKQWWFLVKSQEYWINRHPTSSFPAHHRCNHCLSSSKLRTPTTGNATTSSLPSSSSSDHDFPAEVMNISIALSVRNTATLPTPKDSSQATLHGNAERKE